MRSNIPKTDTDSVRIDPLSRHMTAAKPKVIAIVGPTASGKTSLSIQIAKHVSGEVISADSRQVYRDLDIGTGKVTSAEMAGIPHHVIDVADLNEIYTAIDFTRDATKAIKGILEQQKTPIIAGGTFFYLDLLRGKMQAAPVPADHSFRDSLEHYSNQELLELLEQQDSSRARRIDPHNRRRLVRSLEIINTLGTVPESTPAESPYDWLMLGVSYEKEALREKFARRLAGWLEAGLLEEVANIRERISGERFQELGFEYLITAEYIDGLLTLEKFTEKFVQKNWQYAKQQRTWLQKHEEIQWVEPQDTLQVFKLVDDFLQT